MVTHDLIKTIHLEEMRTSYTGFDRESNRGLYLHYSWAMKMSSDGRSKVNTRACTHTHTKENC